MRSTVVQHLPLIIVQSRCKTCLCGFVQIYKLVIHCLSIGLRQRSGHIVKIITRLSTLSLSLSLLWKHYHNCKLGSKARHPPLWVGPLRPLVPEVKTKTILIALLLFLSNELALKLTSKAMKTHLRWLNHKPMEFMFLLDLIYLGNSGRGLP